MRELIELSPEALRGAIESFVLREGTNYGEREAYIQIDQPDSCETIVTSR